VELSIRDTALLKIFADWYEVSCLNQDATADEDEYGCLLYGGLTPYWEWDTFPSSTPVYSKVPTYLYPNSAGVVEEYRLPTYNPYKRFFYTAIALVKYYILGRPSLGFSKPWYYTPKFWYNHIGQKIIREERK